MQMIRSEKLYFYVDQSNPHKISFRTEFSGGEYDKNNFYHRLLALASSEAKALFSAPEGTGHYLQEPDPECAYTHAMLEIEVFPNNIMRPSTGFSGKKTDTGNQSLAVQLADYTLELLHGWDDITKA